MISDRENGNLKHMYVCIYIHIKWARNRLNVTNYNKLTNTRTCAFCMRNDIQLFAHE